LRRLSPLHHCSNAPFLMRKFHLMHANWLSNC
jgi:hypothetical protein